MFYDNVTAYKLWAPPEVDWAAWAKPVLFTAQPPYGVELVQPPIGWATMADPATAVIVDMPGKSGVEEGLALAAMGYRPVPVYNGVNSNPFISVVDTNEVVAALFQGATVLQNTHLRSDAPPAFLLDANRMQGFGNTPGKYDNRWCVFPQDLPSAAYLKQKGVRTVVVRTQLAMSGFAESFLQRQGGSVIMGSGSALQNDLSHVLRRYQEAGLRICQCLDGHTLQEVNVVKPSRFKSFAYRMSVMAGLRRNPAGGFGGIVPEPTDSSSGGHYYGHG